MSDPPDFDRRKEDLDTFLDRLANELRGDTGKFTSEIHQISYTVSHLISDAFEQVRGNYLQYTTVKQLTNSLEAAFGDPDLLGTAQRQLAALHQRNQDFSR
ncbi:hypothetical protein Q9L58_010446 [Maublancomyces gigas]|uniref:Uncharacterized protein n=1 Tax=Discina gigas TaxID=1032678 RepID=A0ABR3G431_9PEZI